MDGSAEAEPLLIREQDQFLSSWSMDGNILAFTERNLESGTDIWILHRDGETPEPFLVTAFNEDLSAFSPDGRWLAYQSNESGRYEVYAQPFPGPGSRSLISTNGGREPMWSSNGNELFYRNGDSLMVVAIEADSVFTPGVPRFLLEWKFPLIPPRDGARAYDVTPDGRRFVMLRVVQEELSELNVVLNWFEELKAEVGN